MPAMETMASAKATPVPAGEGVATPAKAAAVATTTKATRVSAASTTSSTHQDECAGVLLEDAADIVRLCDRGSGRKAKRTSAKKGRRD
jgi:hypothetical protein